ncbi:MAG: ornithine cyclodeaminase family protein [Thermocladium sp.]
MAILLTENDVEELLSFREAIDAVENVFKMMGEGNAINVPRRRVIMRDGVLHVLQGAVPGLGVAGLKTYLSSRSGTRFVVLLFDLSRGELGAIIEADRLGQMRTGAATAVATKLMRPNASVLGIVGSGVQARAQFDALREVLRLDKVIIHSRTKEHAAEFAKYVEGRGIDARVADNYEDVCRVDVLVTATNSKEPFIDGKWLPNDIHVNAIGSNWGNRAELMPSAVMRAELIAVDDVDQARSEAGDIIMAGADAWQRVVPLSSIVNGLVKPSGGVTLFKSLGIAVEDLAVAKIIYEKARRAGTYPEFPCNH